MVLISVLQKGCLGNIDSTAPKNCLKYIKSFQNLPLIHARAASFTLRKKRPLLAKLKNCNGYIVPNTCLLKNM